MKLNTYRNEATNAIGISKTGIRNYFYEYLYEIWRWSMCVPGVISLVGDVYAQFNPQVHQSAHRTPLTNKLMNMSIALRVAGVALGVIAFAAVLYTAGMQTIGTITLIAGAVGGIIAHDLISLGEATKIGAELPFMFSESLGLPDAFVSEVIKTILAVIRHFQN